MVDILVLDDQQEPTYTKMALVPWSMGVNVGSRHRRRARDADRSQDHHGGGLAERHQQDDQQRHHQGQSGRA